MLSRVAESLYWMSRYMERAENIARLLEVSYSLELEPSTQAGDDHSSGPLDNAMGILGCRELFFKDHERTDRDQVLRFLTFEKANPQSIVTMISRARENARATQQIVTGEAWSQVNRLYLDLSSKSTQRRFQLSPLWFFDRVKRACMLWNGLVESTLPRDEVYHFLHLGRHLERADLVSRMILAGSRGFQLKPSSEAPLPTQLLHCTVLLRICSAYESFLRTYRERVAPPAVVHYLVLDPIFPRALRFCVTRCRDALHEISGGEGEGYGSEAERQLGRLDGELRYIDVSEIFDRGLPGFLSGIQHTCQRIGDEVNHRFFAA